MAAEEQTRLAAELDFYAAHKREWLEEHSEKYAVVQDRNVLGFSLTAEASTHIKGRAVRFRAAVGKYESAENWVFFAKLVEDLLQVEVMATKGESCLVLVFFKQLPLGQR